MEENVRSPGSLDLSPSLIKFLDKNFKKKEDLLKAGELALKLTEECSDLDKVLADLEQRFITSIESWISHYDRTQIACSEIKLKLYEIGASNCVPSPSSETALKLDSLIGDIEDAVSTTVSGLLRKSSSSANYEETRLFATEPLKCVEDILISITKSHPQWIRLISAVDQRIDRALAILRPQVIADHRALLTSLGWPPPLSGPTKQDLEKGSSLSNPLFLMQGDLKYKYFSSFLALCNLQELQTRRRARQLVQRDQNFSLHHLKDQSFSHHHLQDQSFSLYQPQDQVFLLRQPLWTIEELVTPIALASRPHFLKWVEKPEFIFALVYKITRDFVESVDEILQPLVDKARLSGYSCREEWVSSMATSLTTHLAKEIFPVYVGHLEDERETFQVRLSWLRLVDLMISFDRKMQGLIASSRLSLSLDEEILQRVSCMSVFCDRPDWLEIWGEIELKEAQDKLKPEIEAEKSWKGRIQGAILLSDPIDYKAPAIAEFVLRCLSSVIERSRSLPRIHLRARFIRLSGVPTVRQFLDSLLQRCQEAEGLTALTDETAMKKVAVSVNSARYCVSVLKEWCEDVCFLEMAASEREELQSLERGGRKSLEREYRDSVFGEEIEKLEEFREEWVAKLWTVVLRGFDARCRNYLKNRKQWLEKGQLGVVNPGLLEGLDYIQGRIVKMQGELNEVDFVGFWRGLAGGLDQTIFGSILANDAVRFSEEGSKRFIGDMEALFSLFGVWCVRGEAFFPRVSEGLRVMRLGKEDKERWLREKSGMRHLNVGQVERLLRRCP
ncbi:RINT1-like protein MAG2 isoform X2 [Amborella trichopoda]|uniref:RINT1-like protein MAG2 isoform X2 n=1 Tax=Amborella trichopoda TaxID=13333 RepID=UPI0009BD252F|nr:RINT1-like protein MAG2 isoform X2 [Amborella trichopoda]|eukprot:XP_020521561.1 RINT1-like protein MAG2 isoform X2 [Amborella trichopoda]